MSRSLIFDDQEWLATNSDRKRAIFVGIDLRGYIFPSPDNDVCGITIADEQYDMLPYKPRFINVQTYGEVEVIDHGSCKVGEYCDCCNGIAIPGSKWKVLSRLSEKTIMTKLT